MKNENRAPAFPRSVPGNSSVGMSLREYLAACVDVSVYEPVKVYKETYGRRPSCTELAKFISVIRYLEADAIIERGDK